MAEAPRYSHHSHQLVLIAGPPTGFVRPLSHSFVRPLSHSFDRLVYLLDFIRSIVPTCFEVVNCQFNIGWTRKIMFVGVCHFNCWTKQKCANPSRLN